MSRSSVSSTSLLEALVTAGVLTQDRIVTLLGEARHTISLNDLEMTLVTQDVLSARRLVQLKGMLAGRKVLEDTDHPVRIDVLSHDVVRHTGSMLLDRTPLTVACVEDSEDNLEIVGIQLGTTDFEVWLITAPQFEELFRLHYQGAANEATTPLPNDIYQILDEGIRRRASDIHLSSTVAPNVRVDGGLVSLPFAPLTGEWLLDELAKITSESKLDHWHTHGDSDFAYTYGSARFRVNLGLDRFGMTVALRKIPTIIPTMDDLGLPLAVRELVKLERGLVLVTGPTGSGKSTTLAAMLAYISRTMSRHIITLEDPIEFFLPNGKAVIHQRELGQSFFSFPAGLRQALRQDPDVILVGEMRDAETMRTALTAAETGHLVFATLHTSDAASTVARVVNTFPAEEQVQIRAQLAYILKGVVSQSLLPLATSKGRVAALELMLSTPAIANNLRKADGHTLLAQTIETSVSLGMRTMEMALVDLVRRGLVSLEEAEHRAPDRESFRQRLSREDQ